MANKWCVVVALISVLTTTMTSCGNSDNNAPKKVTAAVLSAPYELLLVADKKWLSSGDGIEFRNIVERPIEGLPQPEPNFRVTTLSPKYYEGQYLMYGNIFIADIDEKYTSTEIEVNHDVHATPQVVVTVKGPSSDDIMIYLDNRKDSVLSIFNNNELKRECRQLKKNHSANVSKQMAKVFGMDIFAPKDMDTVFPHEGFIWATSSSKANQNLCVYTYPYSGNADFTLERIIEKRDSVMKIRVQGEHDGQYMKTEPKYTKGKIIRRNNKTIFETRGLWIMVKDAMGGPFVSYAQLDTVNNMMVVAEGFVFAPNEKKRPLIRELEATLQTLKLPTKKSK